jgi:hypothetical protein
MCTFMVECQTKSAAKVEFVELFANASCNTPVYSIKFNEE